MTKEPTQEQQNIIDYPGNTVVTAKPGSGKTYTVVEKIGKVLTLLPDYDLWRCEYEKIYRNITLPCTGTYSKQMSQT